MELVAEMKLEATKTVLGLHGDHKMEVDDRALLSMSTLKEEGVIAVKNAACERLLEQRVELKMKSKKINDCLNRIHVAMPKPRDGKERLPCIPQVVLDARAQAVAKKSKKLEKDFENENGGPGVYSASLKKNYILANEKWKEDIIPEIMDGHNVFDFVDPNIMQRLEELEREEGLRLEGGSDEDNEMVEVELTPEEKEALAAIRKKKKMLVEEHRVKKSTADSRPIIPRKFDKDRQYTTDRMGRHLSSMGLDPTAAIDRARSRSASRRGRKRERSAVVEDNGDAMDIDQPKKKLCMSLRSRSKSRPPGEVFPGEGFKDSSQKLKAMKLGKKASKKRNKDARRGEADRVIPNMKPKHLFSGKRSTGKTDRR